MGNRKEYLLKSIVKFCHRLDQKGFGANHDGNITVRFEDVLLATPTAESKGLLTDEMIITLDMDGKKIEGIGKPFSEIGLHLAAYLTRSDVMAVVHAHPPFATARGLLGLPIRPALPEAIVSVGDNIPIAEYSFPGSPENQAVLEEMLHLTNVLMIAGNGVLTVGTDLEQAYLRLELVEHLAKVDFYAREMGRPMELPEEDIAKLLEKRKAAGLDPRGEATAVTKTVQMDPLKKLISDEIKKILQE